MKVSDGNSWVLMPQRIWMCRKMLLPSPEATGPTIPRSVGRRVSDAFTWVRNVRTDRDTDRDA